MKTTLLSLVSSLVVALALTVLAAEPAKEAAPAAAAATLTAKEAAQHVGENATICGTVVETAYLSKSTSKLTFLNIDGAHPNQPFDVVIADADRAKFTEAPEVAYKGKKICVTGLIEKFKERPQVKVTDPKQITVAAAE